MATLGLLCRQQLRVGKLALTVWSGLMFAMALGTASAAPAASDGSAAQNLVKGLGMGALVGDGPSAYAHPADWFITMKLLAWLPFFIGLYAVLGALGVVLKEEENGNAEFALAQPVSRSLVLAGRMAGVAVGTASLAAATVLGLAAGGAAVGVHMSLLRYAGYSSEGVVVAFAVACMALGISLVTSTYAKALRATMAMITSFFLYDLVIKVASPRLAAGIAGKLTPFGWVDATRVIRDGNPQLGGTLAAGLVAAAFLGACLARYERREVL